MICIYIWLLDLFEIDPASYILFREMTTMMKENRPPNTFVPSQMILVNQSVHNTGVDYVV
jgi:hypothetical protein